MQCPRPRYRSMPAIAMQINHAQVAGILNKAPLDPERSCTRIVSVRKVQKFSASYWNKAYKTWRRRLVKESYGWDSTWIECGGPAKVCEPNPQMLLWAIRKQILLSEVWWKRTSPLSGSSSEGSEGTHLVLMVLMYVDARPRPYLVKA